MQDDEATKSLIRADLHCHTRASDGELTPTQLVERARSRGVNLLAITDHDTVAGLEEARAASGGDLTLINGVELSCTWRHYTIHVVGLDMAVDTETFQTALDQQAKSRWERAGKINERLIRVRLPDVLDAAVALADGDVPGRPHFARALVEAGVVKDMGSAFNRYLGAGKTGDVRECWPALETVVGWIKQAGGLAILAHPRKYRMTATRLRSLVDDLLTAGGDGLEVLTGGQSAGDTGFLADLARRKQCLASIGSDFHAPGMAWNELGSVGPLPEHVEPVWHHFRTH